MAYKRKTKDEWQLQVNYGQGYEVVTTEDTYYLIKDQRKCYAENEPHYPRRIVCKRVPIEA